MTTETIFPTIDQYFQTLTTFPPRDFQRKTIAKLLQRQNILLRAPTGSGKTETAIAPFLFAKVLNYDFPNKLINEPQRQASALDGFPGLKHLTSQRA